MFFSPLNPPRVPFFIISSSSSFHCPWPSPSPLHLLVCHPYQQPLCPPDRRSQLKPLHKDRVKGHVFPPPNNLRFSRFFSPASKRVFSQPAVRTSKRVPGLRMNDGLCAAAACLTSDEDVITTGGEQEGITVLLLRHILQRKTNNINAARSPQH